MKNNIITFEDGVNALNTLGEMEVSFPSLNLTGIIKPVSGFPSVKVYLNKPVDGMKEMGISLHGDLVEETTDTARVYNSIKSKLQEKILEFSTNQKEKELQLKEIMKNPMRNLLH